MNKIILIGNLTKDPELRYTSNQTAVCNFTMAVNRGKDRDGNDKGADFPRIIVYGRSAENCDKYLDKGRKVAIQGRIQTGSYKDKDGKTVYTTDVVAEQVEFLGSGERQQNTGYQQEERETPRNQSFDNQATQVNTRDYLNQFPYQTQPQQQTGYESMFDAEIGFDDDDIPF